MKKKLFKLVFLLLFLAINAVLGKGTIYNKTSFFINIQDVTPPQFPGGEKAFNEFLSKNLKWPKGVEDASGVVVVSFYVETDGQLTNIAIERGMGQDFDMEALRVIGKSPKWIPAVQNNKPVKSKHAVPIRFILSNE